MTCTRVKIAQKWTEAAVGEDRWAWLPWLYLWIGLIAGGMAEALAYGEYRLACVDGAFLAVLALMLYAWIFRAEIQFSPTLEPKGLPHGHH